MRLIATRAGQGLRALPLRRLVTAATGHQMLDDWETEACWCMGLTRQLNTAENWRLYAAAFREAARRQLREEIDRRKAFARASRSV